MNLTDPPGFKSLTATPSSPTAGPVSTGRSASIVETSPAVVVRISLLKYGSRGKYLLSQNHSTIEQSNAAVTVSRPFCNPAQLPWTDGTPPGRFSPPTNVITNPPNTRISPVMPVTPNPGM